MNDVTNELLLEILKRIQSDVSDIKKTQQELKQGQIALRDEVHALRGDVLRQERAIASLETDMDRIKHRLDLVDV